MLLSEELIKPANPLAEIFKGEEPFRWFAAVRVGDGCHKLGPIVVVTRFEADDSSSRSKNHKQGIAHPRVRSAGPRIEARAM